MSWLVAKKIWAWLKVYWYVPIILILVTLLILFGIADIDDIDNILEKKREAHQKEIQIIEENQKKSEEEKIKNVEKYVETIKVIEKNYAKTETDLKQKEKKEIKKIITKYEDSPESLGKEIAEKYGWEYVE